MARVQSLAPELPHAMGMDKKKKKKKKKIKIYFVTVVWTCGYLKIMRDTWQPSNMDGHDSTFFFLSFVFLGLYPRHMEITRLGDESEL